MRPGLGAAESRSQAWEERCVRGEAGAGRDGRDADGADTGYEGRKGSREGTEARPERGSSTSPSPRTAANTPAPAHRTHRSTRLSAPHSALRPRARRLLGRRVNTVPGARPRPALSPAPVPTLCPARSPAHAPAPRPVSESRPRPRPRPSPASSPESRPRPEPRVQPGVPPPPQPRVQSGSPAPAQSPASSPRAPRRLGDRCSPFSLLQQPEVASSWLHQVGNLSPSPTRGERL